MKAHPLKRHLFVCTNERKSGHPRGCCLEKSSLEILKRFKKEVKEKGLKAEVRAQRAGCLDTCEFGPSVVVYPENIWYAKVTLEDVSRIVEEHLIAGKPVESLRMPGK